MHAGRHVDILAGPPEGLQGLVMERLAIHMGPELHADQAAILGAANFGQVTTQSNSPRKIQFNARITF